MNRLLIRPETRADHAPVHDLNVAAFEQSLEADLVDRLRGVADPFLSLVAELDGQIVGHILFTPVTVDDEKPSLVLGLAPMAVTPDRQRGGIGSALVARGLEACREAGCGFVVVLGHPEYYPRFGFEPASLHDLRFESAVPDEAFMALELVPGGLHGHTGTVRYHPEFSRE